MYPAPTHPYTFSPDVAVVLAVVTVVVGVVVATVPAMGRGNAEHNVFFQYLKTANCNNCSLPSHTHTHTHTDSHTRTEGERYMVTHIHKTQREEEIERRSDAQTLCLPPSTPHTSFLT